MLDLLFAPLTWIAESSLGVMTVVLFLLLLATMEACFRASRNATRDASASESLRTATGIVTAAMLGLFAFLLGVMFSLAADRYETRRQGVLEEANAIGTAWLRAGLAAEEAPAIRAHLRAYIPLRIEAARGIATDADDRRIAAATNRLQTEIWALTTGIAARAPDPVSASIVAAMNAMFDLATTTRRNARHGVPPYVLHLAFAVAMLSVAAMGYQFGLHGHRQLGITALLLLTWTLSMSLVLDIDSPSRGSVRISPDPLIWTLESWGPSPPSRP